jgi:uncharacterized coiled-coil protein SlyX
MNRLAYFSIVPPPELTRRTFLPCRFVFMAMLIPCLAILPMARAVSPPPDGGYPGNNTAEGTNALLNLTTGLENTANGSQALASNTAGNHNTAIGGGALFLNTTGEANTASGFRALLSNITGSENTANGADALLNNTTGVDNTATGSQALLNNTTGESNTATGFVALFNNTTGNSNTASGLAALENNTTGNSNTATGFDALGSNTTGGGNTATGGGALENSTTGLFNTAEGFQALKQNTTGSSNIAVGSNAGLSLTTGSNNVLVGANAGLSLTAGSNNIDIGNQGVTGDAAKIRIGKQGTQTATYVAGIYGKTVASGTKVAVMIDSTGKLGTVVSSARFKEAIQPMDKASEALLALKPVTFRYKHELDPDGTPQFGLIAEEVEKVNSDLVVRDEDGKVNTVRYEAVNAMLLNEFLKAHRKVEQQERRIEEQDATIAQLKASHTHQQKQIEALTATMQKVNDRLEADRSSVQRVVANVQ